jgi:hypothetical protein
MFKTGQSTKGKITLMKEKSSQFMMHLLVSYSFPVGLAPPLYVSSASTDSGPVRSRFTYNGQVSDRPKFLNMFKTIGPVRGCIYYILNRNSANKSDFQKENETVTHYLTFQMGPRTCYILL